MRLSFRLVCILVLIGVAAVAQPLKQQWVDSVFSTMSIEDKVGQLFLVRISNGFTDPETIADLENKIKSNGIGGILYSGKLSLKQAPITRRLQSASKIPLLMALNGNSDWPIQLDSALTFPSLIAQSAFRDDSLLYFTAREIGRQMKSTGLHVNFIAVNSDDNVRKLSFGEDRNLAIYKSMLWLRGLQSEDIATCAKYFPVKGLSVTGVEKGFPSVQLQEDSLESLPFQALFDNGLRAIIPAKSDFPLFYESKTVAKKNKYSSAALTSAFAGRLVRDKFQFGGLVFVDVPGMTSENDKAAPGNAELLAFQAGNDMLITTPNINAAVRKLKKLVRKEKQYATQLNNVVRRILSFKYEAVVSRETPIAGTLAATVRTEQAMKLHQQNYHSSITIAKNDSGVLPIHSLEETKFFILQEDSTKENLFTRYISKYIPVTIRKISENTSKAIVDSTGQKNVFIAALYPQTSENALLHLLNFSKEPDSLREIIICDFGNLAFRKYAHEFSTVLTAYDDDPNFLKTVPQVLFGAIPASGVLPMSFGGITAGSSVETQILDRLSYSYPEDVGIDSRTLKKIEAIAQEAIENKATPGCNVLVARAGKVIYEKSFGHLTYEKQTPVTEETIYDLASVTKVAATLQTVMFMYDRGLINIHKKASYYLPELKNSNKKDFTLIDILTHQSGLWPFLLFWPQTMADSAATKFFYNDKPTEDYPFLVADNLYASRVMKDSLWSWIINAKIREKAARTPFDFRYSDMGFYILQHLAEKVLNQPLEDFVSQNIYEPLGASAMGYLPLLRFSTKRIAPTEKDVLFRKSLLIGVVHDQGAAMHGGTAGHAGLFGTATDLAKLGQMLLQEGTYGGLQYYKPETVKLFSQKQFASNRRGLGWEKPAVGSWNTPTSIYSSPKTYGHTGFTGTCIWIDPEFDLVYIFLSNRVHPDMTNNKLLSANIRSRIQDVIYQSIFEYCKTTGAPEEARPMHAEATGSTSQ
jgi:beta-N-acetylhexosaminidase